MDILKNITDKLSIIKNNSAIMVPIVIGLIGAILFIPTQLISSKLKKQIENESIARRANIIRTKIKDAVPSGQWQVELQRKQDYASDANQIALAAMQSSKRELLSYKIFPEPKDSSTLIFEEFGRHYRKALVELTTDINALDCPSETELQRALESSTAGSSLDTSYPGSFSTMTGPYANPSRTSPGTGSDIKATIIDEICRGRAGKASVYINPADLSGYEFWRQYKYVGVKEAVEDCWYYQTAYWVVEDIIDTIKATNGESRSVFTSPVKRLLDIKFNIGGQGITSAYTMGWTGTSTETTDIDDRPTYILSPKNSAIKSCTGRYCNNDIDVIHFNVVVVVAAKAVLPFMEKLCGAKEHRYVGFDSNER